MNKNSIDPEVANKIRYNILNLIDNVFQEPKENNYLPIINPATNQEIGRLPDSQTKDIDLAVNSCLKAFKTWSKTTRQERSEYLIKIADIIEERFEQFAIAETLNCGKPISISRNIDIIRCIHNFRYFARLIFSFKEEAYKTDGLAINYTWHTPVGVIGLISPWNLPIYLLSWKIAPCIALGNCCVCKPSELSSVTAFLLASVFKDAQLPPGVVNFIFGNGVNAGNPLVCHPEVSAISFTGGTETGAKINSICASMFKKVSLELGGKNPALVFDDCDFEKCIESQVKAAFLNSGQICLATSRIYVQETVYDEFLIRFVEQMKNWKVGNPLLSDTKLGSVISNQHLNKVQQYIELAKKEGGTILMGGDKPLLETSLSKGAFINPTVIINLDVENSQVLREEIFGPVVTINKFKTEEEAIILANNTKYGLAATVWTENGKKARRVAQQINSGIIWVNCWLIRDTNTPFGGMKQSGIGREGGNYSLDFYTDIKNITLSD